MDDPIAVDSSNATVFIAALAETSGVYSFSDRTFITASTFVERGVPPDIHEIGTQRFSQLLFKICLTCVCNCRHIKQQESPPA